VCHVGFSGESFVFKSPTRNADDVSAARKGAGMHHAYMPGMGHSFWKDMCHDAQGSACSAEYSLEYNLTGHGLELDRRPGPAGAMQVRLGCVMPQLYAGLKPY
jgi:hypothetical protein